MTIPDVAIEAAAEAVTAHYDEPAACKGIGFCNEAVARAAVEAAMPAIREALAQEIEALGIIHGADCPACHQVIEAARIARGGTP